MASFIMVYENSIDNLYIRTIVDADNLKCFYYTHWYIYGCIYSAVNNTVAHITNNKINIEM